MEPKWIEKKNKGWLYSFNQTFWKSIAQRSLIDRSGCAREKIALYFGKIVIFKKSFSYE